MEFFDYFDANHQFLGSADVKKIHQDGLWHHTFHCWIFNSQGQVLFQLRSMKMKTSPGKLDISSAGHIQACESPLQGGLRELQEELGLKVQESDLISLGAFQHAHDMTYPDGRPNLNREFSFVYLLKNDTPLTQYHLQRDELDGLYFANLKDLFSLFSKEVEQIKIEGLIFNSQDELRPNSKYVDISAFNPEFPSEHYLKILIMIERVLEGKKYFGV